MLNDNVCLGSIHHSKGVRYVRANWLCADGGIVWGCGMRRETPVPYPCLNESMNPTPGGGWEFNLCSDPQEVIACPEG